IDSMRRPLASDRFSGAWGSSPGPPIPPRSGAENDTPDRIRNSSGGGTWPRSVERLEGDGPMESTASRSMDRLLVRAREGSQSALNRLMMSCRPWLWRRARARLPRELARKQDVSDLVQESQSLGATQIAEFEGRSLSD